jgi:hypothetical protein
MLRTILDARALVAMILAAAIGVWGLHAHPMSTDDRFWRSSSCKTPSRSRCCLRLRDAVVYNPILTASLTSVVAIVSAGPAMRSRAPPHTHIPSNAHSALVLGEAHYTIRSGRAPTPTWLTIRSAGDTGVMILGAVGTGKTSACMYPFVDRRCDGEQTIPTTRWGLVLEVRQTSPAGA